MHVRDNAAQMWHVPAERLRVPLLISDAMGATLSA
jgi:hypothetical protein